MVCSGGKIRCGFLVRAAHGMYMVATQTVWIYRTQVALWRTFREIVAEC